MTTANAPYDRKEFFRQVIRGLGMDVTSWRRHFFEEWARGENTGAGYNPLATTQVATSDGSIRVDSNWNENGGYPVKNYASFQDGVNATIRTLTNGYYTEIIRALREQSIANPALVAAQIRTWGTMWFADFLEQGGMNAYEGHETMIEPLPTDGIGNSPTNQELAAAHGSLNTAVLALEKRVASVETDRDLYIGWRDDMAGRVDRLEDGIILGPYDANGERPGFDILATLRRHSDRINELDARIAAQNLQIERLQGT